MQKNFMAVGFLAQILGMALLCMNNDVHIWLSVILHSLILSSPSKTFPGQVFSYVCLRWRKNLSAQQLVPPGLLCLEGDGGAGWLQSGLKDLWKVSHLQCHVLFAETCHPGVINPLSSSVIEVGTGPLLQDNFLQEIGGRLGMGQQVQTALEQAVRHSS